VGSLTLRILDRLVCPQLEASPVLTTWIVRAIYLGAIPIVTTALRGEVAGIRSLRSSPVHVVRPLHSQSDAMIGQLQKSGFRQLQRHAGQGPAAACTRPALRRCRAVSVADSATNGASNNGSRQMTCPTPAETARTIVDIVNEAALCSLSADGTPLGAPVVYQLDKDGQPVIQLPRASPEAANLQRDARVSLLVQPTTFPARGVASVALQGSVQPHELEDDTSSSGAATFKLHVTQCMYYGGLDNVSGEPAGQGARKYAAEWLEAILTSQQAETSCNVAALNIRTAAPAACCLLTRHLSPTCAAEWRRPDSQRRRLPGSGA
jgi:hypothetical protein